MVMNWYGSKKKIQHQSVNGGYEYIYLRYHQHFHRKSEIKALLFINNLQLYKLNDFTVILLGSPPKRSPEIVQLSHIDSFNHKFLLTVFFYPF